MAAGQCSQDWGNADVQARERVYAQLHEESERFLSQQRQIRAEAQAQITGLKRAFPDYKEIVETACEQARRPERRRRIGPATSDGFFWVKTAAIVRAANGRFV